MRRVLLACLLALSPAPAIADAAAPFAVGVAEMRIGGPGDSRPLSGYVWYPTHAANATMRFGENAVRRGFDAQPNAPMAEGRFPLLALSHGLYGGAFNQAWLATRLARRGFIAVAVNHPGTTTYDRDPEARARLWLRPGDLGRAITATLEDPRFTAAADASRIAAIGHSLGGFDVIALAGGHVDPARYAGYCAAHPARADCVFVREAGIAADAASAEALAAPLGDPRISAVVAFDLGLTQAFDPESLAAIAIPMLVYGAPRQETLVLDAESRALAAAAPASRLRYLEPEGVGHFDFIDVCKPGAEAILKREAPGDEMVCRHGGAARDAFHEATAETVRAFLDEAWRAPRK